MQKRWTYVIVVARDGNWKSGDGLENWAGAREASRRSVSLVRVEKPFARVDSTRRGVFRGVGAMGAVGGRVLLMFMRAMSRITFPARGRVFSVVLRLRNVCGGRGYHYDGSLGRFRACGLLQQKKEIGRCHGV